jgi:hypothetical protein
MNVDHLPGDPHRRSSTMATPTPHTPSKTKYTSIGRCVSEAMTPRPNAVVITTANLRPIIVSAAWFLPTPTRLSLSQPFHSAR